MSKFHKGAGTTNKGNVYEHCNIAAIALKLVRNEDVKDFHISSNVKDFEKFDDIVVEVELEKGNEVYAIQLKHKDRGNLSLEKLQNKNGDFSLDKYFKSFCKIKNKADKSVLSTNLKLSAADHTQFELEGEGIQVELCKSVADDIFTVSGNHCYKFRMVEKVESKSATKIQEYKTFFDHFFLCADQKNLAELKSDTANTFKNMFCSDDTEFHKYFKFISDWSMQDHNKYKLNKSWIQQAIAIQLLSPRIKPLSFNSVTENMEILREAICEFDIAFFEQNSYDKLKTLWGDAKQQFGDVHEINKIRTMYQLYPIHIKNLNYTDDIVSSKILWLADKCPLIVTEDETVHKAIELCRNKKIMLLKNGWTSEWAVKMSIFGNISDLKVKPNLFQKVTTNFLFTLQEKKELSLKTLVTEEEFLKNITADNLLEMLDNPLNIGDRKETLPFPYIERCLFKPVIDVKYLEEIGENIVIIVYCLTDIDKLKIKINYRNLIDSDNFFNKNVAENTDYERETQVEMNMRSIELKKSNIFVTKSDFSYDYCEQLRTKIKWKKNCHHFRFTEDGNLEWLQSEGEINDFENYKFTKNCLVPERSLWEKKPHNKINLIVSDPGMGKTEMMKSFKNNCCDEFWTVFITPRDIDEFLQKSQNYSFNDFEKFLLEEKYKNLNNLDKKFLKMRIEQGFVFFVWDALDEISNKNLKLSMDLILQFSKKELFQWVTSRCHLKEKLENKFKVLSMSLDEFDEEKQNFYIKNRLSDYVSAEDIEKTIAKIKTTFAIIEHKNILGIPLQLFMLTLLFRQNGDEYTGLLTNTFTLCDLYHHFIEEKFDIYYKQKLGINFEKSKLGSRESFLKMKTLECYENLALKTLLPDDCLKKLNINVMQNLQTIKENNIGLETEITTEIIDFIHTSFAEYLVAAYFSKNLHLKDTISTIIFEPRYINIRFFFDLLLAKKSLPHIAVLYKNYALLEECGNEVETCQDEGGRTVLHIACSWGTAYPRLNVERKSGSYIIDVPEDFQMGEEETVENLKIIKYLLKKCPNLVEDRLFKATPIAYARKCSCLIVILKIIENNPSILKICDRNEIVNILYYSGVFGYDEVLDLFVSDGLPFIQTKWGKNSLLHLSVCHEKFIRKLFLDKKNNKAVNFINKKRETPLYLASQYGCLETAKFLVAHGADINLADARGRRPLFAAALYGQEEIVEFLIESDADVNIPDEIGVTALHYASISGHEEITKSLILSSAKINSINSSGFTPIHLGSYNGHEKVVRCLAEFGADVNLPDKKGETPLHSASSRGHTKIVQVLINSGGKTDLVAVNGATPLHLAAQHGNEEIVEILVKSGADVNFVTRIGTPLYISSLYSREKIVEFLIASGAKVNLTDQDGFSPLHAACRGHGEIGEHLNVYLDVDFANHFGRTEIRETSVYSRGNIVKFLSKSGAEVNLCDKNGVAPLHLAALNGHEEIVEFLIAAGAKVDVASEDGCTPIFIASVLGHEKIVRLLVEAGVDVNHHVRGYTPISAACVNGHEKVVNFLIDSGADADLTTKGGTTAIQVALRKGHRNIVKLLINSGVKIRRTDRLRYAVLKSFSKK